MCNKAFKLPPPPVYIRASEAQSRRRTHQTVKLRHRALVSWVTDIPHLDATLPSCVNVSSGVTDGHGAHHLAVVQRVYLTGVTRDPRAHQSVWGERNRLHLSIGSHVKRIGPGRGKESGIKRRTEPFLPPPRQRALTPSAIPQGDSISLQTEEERKTHSRFATRDPRQTGGHSRNPHVRMRIEANLQKEKTSTA